MEALLSSRPDPDTEVQQWVMKKEGIPILMQATDLWGRLKKIKWTQRLMVICILEKNSQEGRLSKFLTVFSEQAMEQAECSRLREQQVQRP